MSLDISLTIKYPIKKRGTGVFVREDGKNKELTPDEVLDRWPDAEVTYQQIETNEVFDWNITHNLGKMADKAGLYDALWRPDEQGYKYAKDIVNILEDGLKELQSHPDLFKSMNPENGWGSYEGLVECVKAYLVACKKYPDAEIEVDR